MSHPASRSGRADDRLIRELKSYTSANRLILTGTPLHVSYLHELFSELNRRTTSRSYGRYSISSYLTSLMTSIHSNNGSILTI